MTCRSLGMSPMGAHPVTGADRCSKLRVLCLRSVGIDDDLLALFSSSL